MKSNCLKQIALGKRQLVRQLKVATTTAVNDNVVFFSVQNAGSECRRSICTARIYSKYSKPCRSRCTMVPVQGPDSYYEDCKAFTHHDARRAPAARKQAIARRAGRYNSVRLLLACWDDLDLPSNCHGDPCPRLTLGKSHFCWSQNEPKIDLWRWLPEVIHVAATVISA